MNTQVVSFGNVGVGDRVRYVEDTLWGSQVLFVPVTRVQQNDGLVELELRLNKRLVAILRYSANVECRIAARPANVYRLAA